MNRALKTMNKFRTTRGRAKRKNRGGRRAREDKNIRGPVKKRHGKLE
jgi:hypothetical protein